MDAEAEKPVWRFDRFILDLSRGALLAADGTELALRPKSFAVLRHLIGNAGRLSSHDQIMRAVWPGVFVTEDSIAQCVKEIRRALGDGEQRLLRTLPRRGYLLAAEVTRLDQAGAPVPPPGPALPPAGRPMLVVLPFASLAGDAEHAYFADGITEELTTALSHARWFSVIARNSAFTYKGRAVDVRQVGRELGVGYVLEGSVRKAGGRVRIAAQLCEAEAGRSIWAGRFDGELADIFELQDRVAEAVAGAIEPSLRQAEIERARAKPTGNLGAYDLYLRAMPYRRFETRAGNDEALRLLRRAVALDPGFTAAKAALAGLIVIRFAQRWTEEGDVEEAVRCAREVVEAGGADDPTALAWAGFALARLAGDHGVGLAMADRALQLAPNSALVLFYGGWTRLYAGDWQAAIERIERAMRLSPVDPLTFHFIGALAAARFIGGQYEEAADCARRAIRARPTYLAAHLGLAASLARLGRLEEAGEAVRTLLAVAPGETLASIAAHTALRGAVRERYLDALRRAGVPE